MWRFLDVIFSCSHTCGQTWRPKPSVQIRKKLDQFFNNNSNTNAAFAYVRVDEISSAEACTGASAAPDSQTPEEDEVMMDDLMSVSERNPCLGSGKVKQKKMWPVDLISWLLMPLLISLQLMTKQVNSALSGFQSLHHTRLSVAVHLLLSITSWVFIRIGYSFAPC